MTRDQETRGTDAVAFGSYAGPAPRYRGSTTQSSYITMRDGVRLATAQAAPQTIQGFAHFLQSFLRSGRKHGGNPQDTLEFMKRQRQRLEKL